MITTYRIKVKELSEKLIDSIRAQYDGDREVEIVVSEHDETEYLFKSEENKKRLLMSVENVNKGEKLIEIDSEELK